MLQFTSARPLAGYVRYCCWYWYDTWYVTGWLAGWTQNHKRQNQNTTYARIYIEKQSIFPGCSVYCCALYGRHCPYSCPNIPVLICIGPRKRKTNVKTCKAHFLGEAKKIRLKKSCFLASSVTLNPAGIYSSSLPYMTECTSHLLA